MAVSAAVFVGGIAPWKDALVERAQALRVGPGAAAETDVGPLISPEARSRAERLVTSGVEQVPVLAFLWRHRSATLCWRQRLPERQLHHPALALPARQLIVCVSCSAAWMSWLAAEHCFCWT